jgi:hypothetical protein
VKFSINTEDYSYETLHPEVKKNEEFIELLRKYYSEYFYSQEYDQGSYYGVLFQSEGAGISNLID